MIACARWAGAVVVGGALSAAACLTTYNQCKITPLADAPAVETRPGGCNVDVFEDGQKGARKHVDLGHIVLEWPLAKIKEQGPDGAMKTLRAAACESGAFLITDLRALTTGDGGLVYEGELATLLGDDGKPVNLKKVDAPATARGPSGW